MTANELKELTAGITLERWAYITNRPVTTLKNYLNGRVAVPLEVETAVLAINHFIDDLRDALIAATDNPWAAAAAKTITNNERRLARELKRK